MKIEHLKRAEELYENQGSITRDDITRLLNVSDRHAGNIWSIITNKEDIQTFLTGSDSETNIYKEESGKEQTIIVRSPDIKTIDQLIEYVKIDTNIWSLKKSFFKSMEVGKNPYYEVKGVFVKKSFDLAKILKEFREEAEHHAPEYEPVQIMNKLDNILELSIPDLHLGSLVWGRETRDTDYDLNIAKEVFINAVDYFLDHGKSYNPEKIVFLIGSDFFNVDNDANTTSAGTPQSEDSRFQKTFTEGWKIIVNAVDKCREIADVHIVVVPGNHDFQRCYYLGEVLSAWYDKCNNVTVDNGPQTRKYFEYGSNLLGFSHGMEAKIDELPLIMAQEMSEAWGRTRNREFHIGHLHHRKKMIFCPIDERQAVRVQQVSSLASTDGWHSKKGYHSIKEANGFIWNKEKGNIATFNYQR